MSTSHLPPQPAYHHGDLRRALVAAARAALAEEGADRIGLREVARRAGVSPAAPYRHFRNLAELMGAVAAAGFADLAAGLDAAAAQPSTDRLAALGRAYVRFARAHPQLYRLMFGTGIDLRADPALRAAAEAAFARLRLGVGERGDGGDVEVAALSAWAHVHGLSLLLLDGHVSRLAPGAEEALVAAATDRFVAGLRATA